MVPSGAMLDVPRHVVEFVALLLTTRRRAIGTPKGARALGPFQQAILILSGFRDRSCVHCLARDAGVSPATGYRYLHEGTDVLAAGTPDLHQVLAACRQQGIPHVILDGVLIGADRVAGTPADGNDLCSSGTHKQFGGTIQFLATPAGTPVWVLRRRTGLGARPTNVPISNPSHK